MPDETLKATGFMHKAVAEDQCWAIPNRQHPPAAGAEELPDPAVKFCPTAKRD